MAGLFAERLIGMGYCVLVVDPEGDHQDLGKLRQVVVITVAHGTPSPEYVVEQFSRRFTSVVLDMSQMAEKHRHPYLEKLAACVDLSRAECGLPHWIVEDEAHATATNLRKETRRLGGVSETGQWGHCLVTFRPDLLASEALGQIETVIVTGVENVTDELANIISTTTHVSVEQIGLVTSQSTPGQALLVTQPHLGTTTLFSPATRTTQHKRHTHKYVDVRLVSKKRFYFRNSTDSIVAVAANLQNLVEILTSCEPDVVEHHAPGHDL